MNQLAHLNYTFEEIEILKTIIKFQNDPARADELLQSGLNDYEIERLRKILIKFYYDGIWDYEEEQDKNDHPRLKIDLSNLILNYPNPIPEKISSKIDSKAIIGKLSCSNLDLSEINYLTILLKKDAISKL